MGRILIVEDHELLGQSLAFALQADGFVVDLATDVETEGVLELARATEPTVVLLDLHLGGSTSVPLIAPLRELGACVVMVTGETNRAKLAECIEAGASGIVSKSDPFDRLVDAVKEAASLGELLTKSQRDDLLAELRRQRSAEAQRMAPFLRLTGREQQVLEALMNGRSAEQIANEWVVSLSTVRSQIRSLLMKLGVNSQLAAVALARERRWARSPQD